MSAGSTCRNVTATSNCGPSDSAGCCEKVGLRVVNSPKHRLRRSYERPTIRRRPALRQKTAGAVVRHLRHKRLFLQTMHGTRESHAWTYGHCQPRIVEATCCCNAATPIPACWRQDGAQKQANAVASPVALSTRAAQPLGQQRFGPRFPLSPLRSRHPVSGSATIHATRRQARPGRSFHRQESIHPP